MFIVSKTYEVVTPESAERGDFADSGFVYESTSMTLAEVLGEVESLGSYENLQKDYDGSQSLYATDPYIDYSDGSETREALHISGLSRAMKRLTTILTQKRRQVYE